MKKRCSFYNLVEITLAMAAVAIGISGIMGLFVPAVDASREALAESNSSQSIATLLSYIEQNKKKNWATAFPTTPADAVSAGIGFHEGLPDIEAAASGAAHNKWNVISNLPNIYTVENGLFGLAVGEKGSLFCGLAQVWEDTPPLPVSTADPDRLYDPDGRVGAVDAVKLREQLVRIHVRVTYPATLPAAQRKERYYVLEIAKPE